MTARQNCSADSTSGRLVDRHPKSNVLGPCAEKREASQHETDELWVRIGELNDFSTLIGLVLGALAPVGMPVRLLTCYDSLGGLSTVPADIHLRRNSP